MSVESTNRRESIQGELFNNYSKIPVHFKPKIKEIITITIRNLVDLTTCLIQTHHSFVNPNFSKLNIQKILDYEIEAWHNEILSSALASRRNLARLMTDLKYMLSSVNGTESLFMEITRLTNSIREKWTPTTMNSTALKFRESMLDMLLITDPSIKGFYTQNLDFNENFEESEISEQTRTFLDMRSHSGYQSTDYQGAKEAESLELELIAQNLEENYIHLRMDRRESERRKEYDTECKVNSSHMVKNKQISYGTRTVEKEITNDEILVTYSSNESTKKMKNNKKVMAIDVQSGNPQNLKSVNTRSEPTFEKNKMESNLNRKVIIEARRSSREEAQLEKENSSSCEDEMPGAKEVESINIPEEIGSSSRRNINDIQKMVTPKKSLPEKKPEKIVVTPLKEVKNTQNLAKRFKEISEQDHHAETNPTSPTISLKQLEVCNKENEDKRNRSQPKKKYNNRFLEDYNNLGGLPQEITGGNFPGTFQQMYNGDTLEMSKNSDIDRNSTVSFNAVLEEEINENEIDVDDYRIALKKIRRKKKKFINENMEKNSKVIVESEFFEEEHTIKEISKKDSKVFKVRKVEDSSIQQDPELPTFSEECLTENIFTHKILEKEKFKKTPRRAVSDNKFYQNHTPRRVNKQFGQFSAKTPIKYSNQDKSDRSAERMRKFVHQSNFDIKGFLSNRDSEKIHLNAAGLQKIVLSNDQNYLIYGGEGLNVLDMTTNDFKIIRNDKKKSKNILKKKINF